ncbi:MAG: hypothetical protein HY879_27105 [Deltaproteobacteria bacterium]|nr:hypothetical protein [Deltaproteobacteria bacterium]
MLAIEPNNLILRYYGYRTQSGRWVGARWKVENAPLVRKWQSAWERC